MSFAADNSCVSQTNTEFDVGPDCETCGACEQPALWEHTSVDGVFIKQMLLKDAGTMVPQHAHEYDHTSMVAAGSVRVWIDGELAGDYAAPRPLFIKARAKHTFQSLQPQTLIYCIHNVKRTGRVQIHAEHQLNSARI